MQRAENISAIILAAGLSSRMKEHKTELPFDNNRNFLQKISEEYLNFTCKEIIVVFNTENYNSYIDKGLKFNDQIKIVINKYPEKGRFFSLKVGISALSETCFSYIQNIDNPFVNQDILNLLNSNSEKAD
ncbi:MAG: NTP transferase domain-containing protein, partial [Bacteroidales bacterium]|nr:NTP transferase domain-containing protein [Bacteroidales bacterium]